MKKDADDVAEAGADPPAARSPTAGSSNVAGGHGDPTGGFARLGRRIARRTTDLLALAIVAVGLFAVGGKLTAWWNTDPETIVNPHQTDPTLAASAAWGTDGEPVLLDFGNVAWTIVRREHAGDVHAAGDALFADARAILEASPGAPTHSQSEVERRLIETAMTKPPADGESDRWKLYRMESPLPQVVGLFNFGEPTQKSYRELHETAGEASPPADADGWRMVCWGLAMPAGTDRWRLTSFHSPGSSAASRDLPAIPLPPASHRVATVFDRNGRRWQTFSGTGPIGEWTLFYAAWFKEHGWTIDRPWRESARGRGARYRWRDDGRTIYSDVQFRSGDETNFGLVNTTAVNVE